MPVNRLLIIKSDMAQTRKAYTWTPTKEVTFKITGSGKTAAGIKNGIDYITRNGELEAYCYDGKGSEQNREEEKTLTGSLLQLYPKEMITPEHIVEKTSIM